MIGIAYFSLPNYTGKFGLSCKFGLMWGIATATLLFLVVRLIKVLTASTGKLGNDLHK